MKKEREEREKEAKGEKESASGSDGFVASKSGKKYYPAGSAQADKIAEENRVTFSTAEEAEAAGFTA
jgi:hypothetical protein